MHINIYFNIIKLHNFDENIQSKSYWTVLDILNSDLFSKCIH